MFSKKQSIFVNFAVAALSSALSITAWASGVTVTTPTNDQDVVSPFTLQATSTTCESQPVATMAYSIGQGADSKAVNGTSLNAQVTASIGNNQILHVKSWGDKGAGCDQDVTINVVAGGSGVTVTAPTNNEDVNSPFTLQATSTTCDGQTVATMAYSIGNGADSKAVNGSILDVQVTASTGNNQILHVKSWGDKGAGCDTDVTINVTSGQGSGYDGSANIPNPPQGANNNAKIQEDNGWSSATGAASSCPGGVPSPTCNPPNANYNQTVEHGADPKPLSGSNDDTGLFELYNSPAWATVIWGHSIFTNTSVRNFIWDFYVYVTGTNYNASELDLYDTLSSGQRFMMGTQCNRSANSWDTWNEQTQHWIHNTSIPCNAILTPNAWHHVIFYNTVNSSNNTYTYHVIRIDNVDYVLNQAQPTQYVGWPEGLVGVQVQLDTNASGAGVDEYLENMQIYSW